MKRYWKPVRSRVALTAVAAAVLLSAPLLLPGGAGGLTPDSAVVQATQTRNLFADRLGSAEVAVDAKPSSMMAHKRSRLVDVNLGVLPEAADQNPVDLNLFPDMTVRAYIDSVDRRGDDKATWIGHLEGADPASFLLVQEEASVAGTFRTADGRLFQVRDVGGTHTILELDQSRFPGDCPPGGPIEPRDAKSNIVSAEPDAAAVMDSGQYIHVMVVYTAAMLSAAGSQSALNALIALGIAETNAGYAASGISTRVQLAGIGQVSYTETGNISTDLGRLQDPYDGYMDNVHDWRYMYRADLVSLWVANGGAYCGIAYIQTVPSNAFAPWGFNVVDGNDCATGYYSFGHEMGHNQGARHDRYVDNTDNSPYAFNHAYYPGAPAYNAGATWRTVMAYSNGCGGCGRVNRWSNPNLTYNSAVTGLVDSADGGIWSSNAADNRRTLNSTTPFVANFMMSYLQPHVSADFNGNSATDVAVYEAGGKWYVRGNSSIQNIQYGGSSYVPVPGDYDHDGDFDIAVYNKSTGGWWVRNNSAIQNVLYGGTAWQPVPGDYDGNGGTDIAVYNRSTGKWYVRGFSGVQNLTYGGTAYTPVPGDYDGDDDTDVAVYSDTGRWWVYGNARIQNLLYGGANYRPVLGDFNGDGKTDIAVYDITNGRWWAYDNPDMQGIVYGGPGYTPVPGDYDGDGTTDIAVYHQATGRWWVRGMSNWVYGGSAWYPVPVLPGLDTWTCPACDASAK